MTDTVMYEVPGVHCAHCEAAIKREVETVAGVETVSVDLERKLVAVTGTTGALRAAIDEAGYDVA